MTFVGNGNGRATARGGRAPRGLRPHLAGRARHEGRHGHHQRPPGPAEEGQTILRPAGWPGSRSRPCATSQALAVRGLPDLRGRGRGRENTPISCGTQIADGMVVTTHSERVIENRRLVLELIFSDHDAYCLPPCQFKCPPGSTSPAT